MPPIRSGRAAFGVALTVATTTLVAYPSHASVPDSGGWEVVDVAAIDVDGTPLSMSPDGAWLAGLGDDDQVCVWRLPDLGATCSGEVRGIDPDSIAWAPDSSAVAFSALAFLYFIDSDIHVLDVASGTLANVTDDGFDDELQLGDDEPATPAVPVDVMPAWTSDASAIVFSRSVWSSDDDAESTDIMTVPRDGGETTLLGTIDRRFAVYTPMRVLRDGSVLYTVGAADPSDEANGIWQLDPDGSTTQIVPSAHPDDPDGFPMPVISDVSETDAGYEITGYSAILAAQSGGENAERGVAFRWSSANGELTPLEPISTEPRAWVLSAVFAPDPDSLLQLTAIPGAVPALETVGPTSTSAPLPESESSTVDGRTPRHPVPTWADNGTAFVPGIGGVGPVLVTLTQA